MKKVICFLFLSVFSSQIIADEGMLEFKGTSLLSGPEKFEGQEKYFCQYRKGPMGDTLCSTRYLGSESIAGEDVRTVSYTFYDDKLHSIFFLVSPKSVDTIVAALTQKYGKPKLETNFLTNHMGVQFKNEIYNWEREKDKITIKKYAVDLNTASVTFRTNESLKIYTERSSETMKSKAGDL